jgi:hypothetical protein
MFKSLLQNSVVFVVRESVTGSKYIDGVHDFVSLSEPVSITRYKGNRLFSKRAVFRKKSWNKF